MRSGFIAVDNAYCPNPLEETDLALTQAIVELVRDTVLARLKYRLFNGIAGALPLMVHRPRINGCLAHFRGHLRDLMEALRTSPDNVVLISKAAEEVEKSMAKMEVPIREMGAAQQFIEEWRDPSRTPSPVTDLKSHLRGVIRNWEEKENARFVSKKLKIARGLPLACDEKILDNALHCLLENARSVSNPDESGRFRVALSAKQRRVFPFKTMITIEVTDFGPGISRKKSRYLFIEGFTDRRDLTPTGSSTDSQSKHRGRGLGMARAFLLRAQGDLRLKSRGGNGRGATFAIHFGLMPDQLNDPHAAEKPIS